MGKKVNRDREKVLSKADIKANNILKAVKAYEAEDSDLSMRRAATLFHCSTTSISNHIKKRNDVQYLPDLAVKHQKLTPIEEAALKDHIHDCFQSGLSLTPKLLREMERESLNASILSGSLRRAIRQIPNQTFSLLGRSQN
jgi:hypothetical protein